MPIERYSQQTAEKNDGFFMKNFIKNVHTSTVTSFKSIRYNYSYRLTKASLFLRKRPLKSAMD